MNTAQLLHRRSTPATRTRPFQIAPSDAPPIEPASPSGTGPEDTPRRPRDATSLIVALAVAAVATLIVAAVVIAATRDDTRERELAERVAGLTQERDAALADIVAVDAELADVRRQLTDALAGSDDLSGRVEALQGRVAALTEERDALDATVDELTGQAATLAEALGDLRGQLTDMTDQRDAFADRFPLGSDVVGLGAYVGTWDVAATPIHCAGLSACGAVTTPGDLTITRTADGWLRGSIPGYVDGGFSRVGGALHLIAHSTTVVPAADGVPRQAAITLTLFPGGYDLDADGAVTVDSIDGVLTVEAPATATAPAVVAYYEVSLG